jgi:2-keto-4-pentenoate hydratase
MSRRRKNSPGTSGSGRLDGRPWNQTTRARSSSGRKIGLTSEAVQRQLGVDQPDFGVLFADMDTSGAPVEPGRLLQPKVEAEIAFVLGQDLAADDVDLDGVRSAVGTTRVALEIVDSRIAGWDISYADTVADNASSGLYVLGDELDAALDPAAVDMTMSINGVVVSTGAGAACLGSPLNALMWLARTAIEFGEPLRAGQVVLSGALGPMAPVAPGDFAESVLSIDGRPVGTVTTEFAQEQA